MCWVNQSDDAYHSFDLSCNVFLYIFKKYQKISRIYTNGVTRDLDMWWQFKKRLKDSSSQSFQILFKVWLKNDELGSNWILDSSFLKGIAV